MKLIYKFAVAVLGVLLSAYFVPGVAISGLGSAVAVTIFLFFVSFTIKPILTILTLPIHFLTLGFSSLLINAFIFWGVAFLLPGFSVEGIVGAILGSLVVTITHIIGRVFS